MKSLRIILALTCGFVGLTTSSHAQWVEQSLSLRPGWNAVFLEVDPSPDDCDTLFAGLPVESVWDWNRQENSAQFVQDPAALIPGTPGWLTWFPGGHPVASQTSLFILRDGRPYLIKLADNAAPVTWRVTGRPSLRKATWRPGGVNFVGFRVGAQGPTFQSLFAGDAGLAGQPVYTLTVAGVWQQVANLATARPESGKAYWVRCASPAQRTATIEVDADSRLGLSFTSGLAEASVRVRNTSASSRQIFIKLLPTATPPAGQPPLAGPVPLEYWKTDYANNDLGWVPLPSTLSYANLPSGAEWNVRVGVRRPADDVPAGAQFQGLIEVTDDLGTRWLVPVSANASSGSAVAGLGLNGETDFPRAGVWIGEATIRAVSQPAHPGDPFVARPAGGELSFRVIVHVDTAGTARLLQRLYLVRKPAIYAPDPENPGFEAIVERARTVALTDESLIPSIIGPGEIVGRRVSSSAFGFAQPLALSGGPFGTGALSGVVTLGYNHSLNPFKHVYHPDHNNLDERFEQTLPEGKESFTINRTLTLEFSDTDPLGLNPPGWGDAELGGIYRETITGLHRAAIHIAGSFRLVRVAQVGALNDGQNLGLAHQAGARQ
jgi:hypothetical protein